LCAHYEKNNTEQKQEFLTELQNLQIDLNELISNNSDLIKNNAQQLAESLIDYWFVHINLNDKETIQQIFAQNGNSALQDISDMYQKLFKKLNLSKRIAEKIRNYVDGHDKTDLPYEIVADISSELLNKCINTIGFEYFDESELNDLKIANKQNNLGLTLYLNHTPRESDIEELFKRIENWMDIIQTKPEEMKSLPSYRHYIEWYNRLKVGFVSVCDIPNYDLVSNEALGKIIVETSQINF
jgi:arsenate reductase-like glutaredoxin family protein